MSTLIELTASIISSQAASTSMSSEELLKSIQLVHSTLRALEFGEAMPDGTYVSTAAPTMSIKKAFGKKDKIFCMICGKRFTTLKRHLTVAHGLKPAEYRKQFGIKSTQSLAAQNYVESRRQSAIEKNLGAGLVKGRAIRKANAEKKAAAVSHALKPKVAAPADTKKSAVPAKVKVAKVPVKDNKITVVPVKVTKKINNR
jgi:predicted transcriptional regulator